MEWLKVHWIAIVSILTAISALASLLNKIPALTPDAQSPKWKRVLHTILIDVPAFLPKVNFVGLFGLPVNVPYLSISKPGPETPPGAMDLLDQKKSQGGFVRPEILFAMAVTALFIGSLGLIFGGCGATPLTRYYQSTATAYIAAQTCYLELDALDAMHETEIIGLARQGQGAQAVTKRDAWRPQYAKGRLACDALMAAADAAKRAVPLVQAGLSIDAGVQ